MKSIGSTFKIFSQSMKRPFFSLERIANIQDFWNKIVILLTEKPA